MKHSQRGFFRAMFLIWLAFIIGWILNIVQIVHQMPERIGDATGMLVFKIICVFVAPVGSVLGYIGLF